MAPRGSLLAVAVLVIAAACVATLAAGATASGDAVTEMQGRQEVSWRQQLASGIPQGRRLHASGDAATGAEPNGGGRSYTWLKWTAAAILFVEAFIGVLVPVGLKLTAHATWLLSLVNCFAGGVFLTFGIMHIGPDALAAQDDIGLDRFPLAAFFIALSFMCIFFLHRILAPALRLTPHHHTHYPTTTPDGRAIMPKASKANGVAACQRCGDECGCEADSCNCAHHIDADPEAEEAKANVATFGSTAATITNAVTPVTRPYEDELQPAPRPTRGQRIAAIVPPTLILGGLLAHTVLEGLTIGLQQSYGDVVSAFIALASHRWVESIAVSAAFVAAGTGMWAIIAFLSVFSIGPLVGIAIGVSVADTNNWAILVLFGITSGLFIYVGSVGITAEEFAKCDDPAFAATRPRGARFYMYACMFFGFVVVALLQLVPDD